MKVMVIDGQGGGMGRQIVGLIKAELPGVDILVVGTNSTATAAMLKAGASMAATGENAVVVGCRSADVIVGPVGIVIADALLGEITPQMAAAIGQSRGVRILIPVNQCNSLVAGVSGAAMGSLLKDAVDKIKALTI